MTLGPAAWRSRVGLSICRATAGAPRVHRTTRGELVFFGCHSPTWRFSASSEEAPARPAVPPLNGSL